MHPAEKPQPCKPERMQQDDRGIMIGREFASAFCKKVRGVAPGKPKFSQPFCRDSAQQNSCGDHEALFKATQLAVNPGPIAVSRVRDGRPV